MTWLINRLQRLKQAPPPIHPPIQIVSFTLFHEYKYTYEYCMAANYYKFFVIITNFFRNYESTNCSLKITNFKFSAQQKKSP